ncbi:hypothetical protein A2870_03600 [Candidatus Curtissbacteria bacterium RIFCSPHIGHO2_01_FULL_41_11]|uniref:Uncharacterized protein n=1 Tax=Candidatus Curtissbacteria bacterium RIFCSPHIGHO2_01_FULL_41_11 TaxID=1797711 RepID=A0A1F5G5Q3_9BACT|nr:MAG: hypothetical protein A2870_03600 [Candidatus Curtissbacteria bacterium RIFCSPHIGHO2_01_FULL_41_11]
MDSLIEIFRKKQHDQQTVEKEQPKVTIEFDQNIKPFENIQPDKTGKWEVYKYLKGVGTVKFIATPNIQPRDVVVATFPNPRAILVYVDFEDVTSNGIKRQYFEDTALQTTVPGLNPQRSQPTPQEGIIETMNFEYWTPATEHEEEGVVINHLLVEDKKVPQLEFKFGLLEPKK